MATGRQHDQRVTPPPEPDGQASGRRHPFSVEGRQFSFAATVTPLDRPDASELRGGPGSSVGRALGFGADGTGFDSRCRSHRMRASE